MQLGDLGEHYKGSPVGSGAEPCLQPHLGVFCTRKKCLVTMILFFFVRIKML